MHDTGCCLMLACVTDLLQAIQNNPATIKEHKILILLLHVLCESWY
jgi:hypothetical protein